MTTEDRIVYGSLSCMVLTTAAIRLPFWPKAYGLVAASALLFAQLLVVMLAFINWRKKCR